MLRRHALASFLSVACSAATGAPARSSGVFEAFFRHFGEVGRTYIVRDSMLDASASPGASKALIREFPVRQAKHTVSDFGVVPVRLLTDAEYIDIFSDARSCAGSWEEFRRRFPGTPALLAFSAIGFPKSGAEASVLAHVASACFGGRTDRYRFLRHGSSWRFAEAANLGRS